MELMKLDVRVAGGCAFPATYFWVNCVSCKVGQLYNGSKKYLTEGRLMSMEKTELLMSNQRFIDLFYHPSLVISR